MTGRTVDHATARRAAIVTTIWLPLAIVVAAELVVILVGSGSGHALIVHWGAAGHRTGPWWTYAVIVAATGVPVIALMGYFIVRATRMAGTNTWMPAIAVGVTVFHAIGMGVGSVLLNSSPLAPGLPLAGGLALAVAAALITWRALPREAAAPIGVEAVESLPVRPGEVAGWTGSVELPTWFVVLVTTAAAGLIAIGLLLVLTGGTHAWRIFVAPAVLLTVIVLTAQFVVTAGPRGLLVRSVLGWPRLTVPASQIATAGVVTIDPMADFGGWGIRWVVGPNRKGRWGVITRRGPGLEVVRTDGRSIVVTVDDPATAAAVLEIYAKRWSDAR